jgi:hypothetical protein
MLPPVEDAVLDYLWMHWTPHEDGRCFSHPVRDWYVYF